MGKAGAGSGTRRGILMFLVLLICLAAIVLIGTELFQVENISVTGSAALDEGVIISTSGISYGDNILQISKDQVKKRIESNPPFQIVEGISITLPHDVHIMVTERVPAAVIPYLSSHILVDSSGFILDILKQAQQTIYPVVEGVSISKLTKGTTLEPAGEGSYQQKILVRMLQALEEWDINQMIQTLDLDNPDDIVLITRDGIRVKLGQAVELDRKLGWLQSAAYTEVLQRDEAGVFDVSVPGKAIFHPQTSSADQEEDSGEPADDEDEDSESDENEVTG